MSKSKKKLTGKEKISLLRKHWVEKVPVSTVCEEGGLSPAHFYRLQQELFEKGAELLEGTAKKQEVSRESEKIKRLESKLKEKDEVLAELMSEYVTLKKKLGAY